MSRAKLHHCPQVLRLVGWKASISYTENMGMTFIVVTLQVLRRQLHFATSNLSATADYFILFINTNLYVFECETK